MPEGAEPIATAYAGHQFGHFVPQLGDGRAILLGEVTDRDGVRRDIQLKGSGPTPFSRRGDGRAAIGPVLREYVVSEAMAALGIPTTRALAAVTTGETVVRDRLLPGAVLTRVAASHIRVGTFQFFAARGDTEGVRLLADHVIARHYPEAAESDRPYRALLDQVIARQAELVARWLLVGFIHGVMNTDNMSVAGETIDYGPCAFMDAYDPATVFSSIDHAGRYAYANQPGIALWNLTRLAETLLPLLSEDKDKAVAEAQEALGAFAPRVRGGVQHRAEAQARPVHGARRGCRPHAGPAERHGREPCGLHAHLPAPERCGGRSEAGDEAVRRLFADPPAYDGWAARWRQRLSRGAAGRRDAPGRDAGRQPGLHSAQSPGGGGDCGCGGAGRLCARSRSFWGCCPGPTRTSRPLRITPSRPSRTSASFRRSAGREGGRASVRVDDAATRLCQIRHTAQSGLASHRGTTEPSTRLLLQA